MILIAEQAHTICKHHLEMTQMAESKLAKIAA
jgi:hypothetical protein